jgi:hypothetical protein
MVFHTPFDFSLTIEKSISEEDTYDLNNEHN